MRVLHVMQVGMQSNKDKIVIAQPVCDNYLLHRLAVPPQYIYCQLLRRQEYAITGNVFAYVNAFK